jgi:hypothetical protein
MVYHQRINLPVHKTESGDIIEAAAVCREGIVGHSSIRNRNGMALWAQMQISGETLQDESTPQTG